MSAITLQAAVDIAQKCEPVLAAIGCHIALTGGCLYRGGSEKDIDYIIYPHDPKNAPAHETIADALIALGFVDRFVTDENYVNRIVWICGYSGVRVDFFMS